MKHAIASRNAGKRFYQPVDRSTWLLFSDVLKRPTLIQTDLDFLEALGVEYEVDESKEFPNYS